jgi:hypothetical protein
LCTVQKSVHHVLPVYCTKRFSRVQISKINFKTRSTRTTGTSTGSTRPCTTGTTGGTLVLKY